MITEYQNEHLAACRNLMMEAFNTESWGEHWTEETAKRYLQEYTENRRFVGYLLWEGQLLAGAAFCHERTWWTKDELVIDEFYISPSFQRKGCGKRLLQHLEDYVRQRGLAGFTLLTNRNTPAPDFYRKNGFQDAEHILYMYKEL